MIQQLTQKFTIAFVLLFSFWACTSKVDVIPSASVDGFSLLEAYVMADDPAFSYELVYSTSSETYDYHVVRMVSQTWLTAEEVNETEWWHYVSFVVPKNTSFETGFLWIGGGAIESPLPEEPNPIILEVALRTNSVAAEIHNVPFQPLTFLDDDKGPRYEDDIIAYGWRKFMEGGAKDEDARWLLRLPMTKAAKLAMDVVVEVVEEKYELPLNHFVVSGASKRGWTTWTTAAVDKRVVAMAPIVIDLLNLEESFQHHWRNYGYWAPAVTSYVNEDIMDWQGSMEFERLLSITEPYAFKEKFADIPKLIVNAAGDEFFQPDSWKFYWDELPGEKHLMYVPNYGHDLRNSDALANVLSFYASILNQSSRPTYEWAIKDNSILLQTDPNQKPVSIKLWSATNEEERNFMIDRFGPHWSASEVLINESGRYEIQIPTPEKGYTGYFVEVTYPGQIPIKITSGVEVLPREYPFESYVPSKALGTPRE
ncbi:PhoPQ-activated pathogenicity-related family protein [Mongoliitalea lutea]|uniref:PhoPQ-regulated protein n=1 Tax=Mongoliitalea lutea TaxID=849756 RepID=A0A8J3CYQ3_9BACT|nr:PhoPQ-activated protein PqaA family protein [Mongoliitalea lutea]GHB43904.1 PhoPQ-regulated protein [Mongoliitalea lutea]